MRKFERIRREEVSKLTEKEIAKAQKMLASIVKALQAVGDKLDKLSAMVKPSAPTKVAKRSRKT